MKLTTTGRLPDTFEEAPILVLRAVRPIRNGAGDLAVVQHLIPDPNHPDGYRLALEPGDYDGPIWFDGDGRAHPVE